MVVAFGQIFPRALLALPRLGCINLHASLLPRHRGAAPIQAAIAAGDERDRSHARCGWRQALDTGPILLQERDADRRRRDGGRARGAAGRARRRARAARPSRGSRAARWRRGRRTTRWPPTRRGSTSATRASTGRSPAAALDRKLRAFNAVAGPRRPRCAASRSSSCAPRPARRAVGRGRRARSSSGSARRTRGRRGGGTALGRRVAASWTARALGRRFLRRRAAGAGRTLRLDRGDRRDAEARGSGRGGVVTRPATARPGGASRRRAAPQDSVRADAARVLERTLAVARAGRRLPRAAMARVRRRATWVCCASWCSAPCAGCAASTT